MISEAERLFATRAVARRRIFLILSVTGIAVAVGLAVWAFTGAREALGMRLVLVILVLLNSRQNLRQYKYAGVIEKLLLAKPSASSVSKPE